MRYYIALTICLALSAQLFAQKTVQMSAIRANDYGVVYSLPKTTIEITTNYTKTTRTAGEFYQYAERYLSITNPIAEDQTIFSLDKIVATTKGVVNKAHSFQVELRAKSTAGFVTLTQDGLLCAINEDYEFPSMQAATVIKEKAVKTVDPYTFLSEEILRAGSTAKQAELIAKQIYRLRESRTDILTGDADNMPPDGDSYKLVMNQLDEQEKALTEMFIGKETSEELIHHKTIEPTENDLEESVLFRFSAKLGIVHENDLSGAPVYVSLINKNPKVEQVLTAKEMRDMEKKFSEGIIFNVPSKANLTISYMNKDYVKTECDVVQFGTQDVLVAKMFENNKLPIKVIFYPELGSIKQIIQ